MQLIVYSTSRSCWSTEVKITTTICWIHCYWSPVSNRNLDVFLAYIQKMFITKIFSIILEYLGIIFFWQRTVFSAKNKNMVHRMTRVLCKLQFKKLLRLHALKISVMLPHCYTRISWNCFIKTSLSYFNS